MANRAPDSAKDRRRTYELYESRRESAQESEECKSELTAEDLVDSIETSGVARVGIVGLSSVDTVNVVEPWRSVGEDEMCSQASEVLTPQAL